MKSIFIVAFALAIIVPAFLWAQSSRESYAETSKMEVEADKQLNAAYQRLIKKIRDEGRPNADLVVERLQESQRAWLKYRDAQAAFVGIYADIGSSSARAAGMASYSIELTRQRIKDLEKVPDPF